MRVSIVVPDGMVIIDGIARQVSMTGVEAGLHAVQWYDTEGEAEYGKPDRRNVAISDLAPYQFLIARWTAAAPTPRPPIVPPTKDEQIDLVFRNDAMRALLLELAERGGLASEGALRAAARARMP